MRWILTALVAASVASLGPARAHTAAEPHFVSDEKQVTVSGTVELVRDNGLEGCELCEACSDCSAVHVLLRTRTGHVEVHLAPAWFLDRLEFAPSTGDVVRIVGSQARMPKGRGLTAHEIHVGSVGIRLRDEHGLPLWRRILTDTRESSHETIGR